MSVVRVYPGRMAESVPVAAEATAAREMMLRMLKNCILILLDWRWIES